LQPRLDKTLLVVRPRADRSGGHGGDDRGADGAFVLAGAVALKICDIRMVMLRQPWRRCWALTRPLNPGLPLVEMLEQTADQRMPCKIARRSAGDYWQLTAGDWRAGDDAG
jgi:hypothetical protein